MYYIQLVGKEKSWDGLLPHDWVSVGALALPVRRDSLPSTIPTAHSSSWLAVGFPGRSVGLSPRVSRVLAGLTWSPCDLTPCPWGCLAFRHDYDNITGGKTQEVILDVLHPNWMPWSLQDFRVQIFIDCVRFFV